MTIPPPPPPPSRPPTEYQTEKPNRSNPPAPPSAYNQYGSNPNRGIPPPMSQYSPAGTAGISYQNLSQQHTSVSTTAPQNIMNSYNYLNNSNNNNIVQYATPSNIPSNQFLNTRPPPPPPPPMQYSNTTLNGHSIRTPNNNVNGTIQRIPPPPPPPHSYSNNSTMSHVNTQQKMHPQYVNTSKINNSYDNTSHTFTAHQNIPPPIPTTATIPPQYPIPSNINASNITTAPLLQNQPKIDPETIPHVPIFTRPLSQPAPIYYPKQSMLSISDSSISSNTHNNFTTPLSSKLPPQADSRYLVCDDGNASPRLLRSSSFLFPKNSSVERKSGITMALLSSPLSVPSEDFCFHHRTTTNDTNHNNVDDSDNYTNGMVEQIPVIFSDNVIPQTNRDHTLCSRPVQPIRCKSCRAYINPFTIIEENRNRSSFSSSSSSSSSMMFKCNFCLSRNNIPLIDDPNQLGYSVDVSTLPFKYGTVEYEVGGEYINVKNRSDQNEEHDKTIRNVVPPLTHIFAIDCKDTCKLNVYLSSLQEVADSIARSWDQQQQFNQEKFGFESTQNNAAPRIGFLLYVQDYILIPYWKRRQSNPQPQDGNSTDENIVQSGWEVAVSLMTDVTDDPFCPLPIDVWTFPCSFDLNRDSSNTIQSHDSPSIDLFHQLISLIPSILQQMIPNYESSTTSQQQMQTQNPSTTDNRNNWNCAGAAMAVMVDALSSDSRYNGARCTLLTSSRPNYGVGALRDRENNSKVQYERALHEKLLYTPLQHIDFLNVSHSKKQEDIKASKFYKDLVKRSSSVNVSINIVMSTPYGHEMGSGMMGRHFLDIATLGEICRSSGGKFKWIKFEGNSHEGMYATHMKEELIRCATSFSGTDAIFKLRCSQGIQVKSYLHDRLVPGTLVDDGISQSPELEIPSVSSDTCFAIELSHRVGGVPKDQRLVFFQSALLYTTNCGRRRVRVTTLALQTTENIADIYKSCDFSAITALMTRQSICDLYSEYGSPSVARDKVMSRCVNILANYRQNTPASKSPKGQLILPESLQLLPLFALSLRKSRMLRTSVSKDLGMSVKPSPLADERAYYLLYGGFVTPVMALLNVHPNIFKLSGMEENTGKSVLLSTHNQYQVDDPYIFSSYRPYIELPLMVHPSLACLNNDGIYLLDDGFNLAVYICCDVNMDLRTEILSYSDVDENGNKTISLSNSSDFGKQIWQIILQCRKFSSMDAMTDECIRPTYAPVIVIIGKGGPGHRVGIDNILENDMIDNLVEDSTSGDKSYVDFLCAIHKQIKSTLS